MTSRHKNSEELCSSMTKNVDIGDKRKKLSCPFTWGMEEVIGSSQNLLNASEDRFETVVDIQEYFPQFVLVYHLTLAYENFMSGNPPAAMKCIDEAEKSLNGLKKNASLKHVKNVLQHIFDATHCYVLQELEETEEAEKLLREMPSIDNMNKTQLAMLSSCECLCWTLYHDMGSSAAMKCAAAATEYEPNNGSWYFLLGKNYRKCRRRSQSLHIRPTKEEVSAFEKAYDLSKNALFGVSCAQMYREMGNVNLAKEVYMEVYNLKPSCCKVQLQLALGFIRAKERVLAKNCLDYVAKEMPNSANYNHYRAIYEERCHQDLKAALSFYKIATDNSVFPAEMQYIKCKRNVERDWDPLPYFLGLLNKYDKHSDRVKQEIYIEIGTHYLLELKDVVSACPYFIRAIQIRSDTLLKYHTMQFRSCFSRVNMYEVLTKDIESALRHSTRYNDVQISVLREAQRVCDDYYKDIRVYSIAISPSYQRNHSRSGSSLTNNPQQSHSSSSMNRPPRSAESWRKPNTEGTRKDQSKRNFSCKNKNDRSHSTSSNRTRGNHSRSGSSLTNNPQQNHSSSSMKRPPRSAESWRKSDTEGTRKDQSKGNFSCKNKNDRSHSTSSNRTRGEDAQPNASSRSRSRPQNNDTNESDAACCLVETLKATDIF